MTGDDYAGVRAHAGRLPSDSIGGASAGCPAGAVRRVRTKVCGVVDVAGACAVEAAGADFMGVILSPGFRRSVPPARARELYREYSGKRVGVFVDADPLAAARTASRLGLDVVQLHGAEPPRTAARIRAAGSWRVWKTVHVRPDESLARLSSRVERYRGAADGVLADAWSAGAPGGTGRRFAWSGVGEAVRAAAGGAWFVVAGGLAAENVAMAIEALAPDVVDASSGVEAASGTKDPARTAAFVAAAASGAPEPGPRRVGAGGARAGRAVAAGGAPEPGPRRDSGRRRANGDRGREAARR